MAELVLRMELGRASSGSAGVVAEVAVVVVVVVSADGSAGRNRLRTYRKMIILCAIKAKKVHSVGPAPKNQAISGLVQVSVASQPLG